jgi:hypothetical protein
VAERWCWEVARREDTRIARRLDRKQMVDGVDRLDEGAVLDGFWHVLDQVGVMALLAEVRGAAIPRELRPVVQDVLLDGLKPRFGIASINARPALWFSDAALRPWVGFNAPRVRDGLCQRGAAMRQGERTSGPIGPDPWAKTMVQGHLRPLEAVCNGASRALAQAGVLGTQVTGLADGTDLETPERDRGCGQVTRTVRREDTPGRAHKIAGTVDGWKVRRLSDAATKIPLAVQVGEIHAPETHWTRAWVTQARANLAGAARLHQGGFERGVWAGTDRWWLDQQGMLFVVPAKANMAVTAEARAQAAAGEGLTRGRRGHTVRHGQGKTAWTARQETDVVGISGLTTSDQ